MRGGWLMQMLCRMTGTRVIGKDQPEFPLGVEVRDVRHIFSIGVETPLLKRERLMAYNHFNEFCKECFGEDDVDTLAPARVAELQRRYMLAVQRACEKVESIGADRIYVHDYRQFGDGRGLSIASRPALSSAVRP